MTQIYLIRHGDYILQDTPPYDLGLSPKGRSQVEYLRDRLAKENLEVDVLISSPWTRAQQTAEIIAPAVKRKIKIEPDIDEWRNNGEGALNGDQIIQLYLTLPPDQRAFISAGPGLETWAQFGFRICNTLNKITREHENKNIMIVAHGGVIEASFLFCYGVSPLAPAPFMMMLDPKHTSITHWRKIHAVNLWRLEKYNDVNHLED